MIGFPSIDQLRIFIAVAEAGSFSAAARRLNRAQSVISYAIANLEEQLGGIALFDRSAHRPALTARSEEHTSELQSLMRSSYAVFCSENKNNHQQCAFRQCNIFLL